MKTDNELIAEFMGMTRNRMGLSTGNFMKGKMGLWFHTSWDWLMPVVEKIGKLYEEAFPPNEKFIEMILAHEDPIDKHYIDVISTSICTPINEVYEEVIKFIKWHQVNSQSL